MKKLLDLIRSLFSWPDIEPSEPTPAARKLAWGQKFTQECREKVFLIAEALMIPADWVMAIIAFETGERFRPDTKNLAGSGAIGLIQFMPDTARGLGTTIEDLSRMTVLEQLDYVYRYFKPYAGRLKTLSDCYMAVLWPAAIGKPEDWVLWTKLGRPVTYRQNAGLDDDLNAVITKAEAAARVQKMLEKGLQPGCIWVEKWAK